MMSILVSHNEHQYDVPAWWATAECAMGLAEGLMRQMQDIHEKLREMILSLDLGPGERLSERWLEGKFAGSRTPVRAALIRLEAEGLVCREGRNWAVSPIDLGEIEAL